MGSRLFGLRVFFTSLLAVVTYHVMADTQPANAAGPVAAYAADDDAAASERDFLDRLIREINHRRGRAGVPPLMYLSDQANRAVSQYLADLVPFMVVRHACFHGNYDPVAPAWDYVASATPAPEDAVRGEVLACPMVGYYWRAPDVAETWWRSPVHQQALYADPETSDVACGLFDARRDGVFAAACVVYAMHRVD